MIRELPESLRNLPQTQLKKLEAIIAHLHRNLGHIGAQALAQRLRRGKAHPHLIAMAEFYRCEACDALKRPPTGQVVSGKTHVPGQTMELDNLVWQHPLTLARSRGACLLDVGSKLPIVRIHKTMEDWPNSAQNLGNNTTEEYIKDLVEFWFPYYGRPNMIRTDPEGTFISGAWKKFPRTTWYSGLCPTGGSTLAYRQRRAHHWKLKRCSDQACTTIAGRP